MSPFWRRDEPIHKRLGRALMNAQAGGFLAHPPDVWGDVRGEPGIHGIPRPRRWDAVATARARVPGEELHFVALEDGTLVVDEETGDADLSPLADAIEAVLERPYKAEAVHKGGEVWAVAANKVDVAEIFSQVDGDVVELAVQNGDRTTLVDGLRVGALPEFELLAAGMPSFALRAERLERDLWAVKVAPL